MATKVRLNNFRFSIYIDADGTVTLTDLPPELREVAEALDPSQRWGTVCPVSPAGGADAASGESLPPGEPSADVEARNNGE